jgi:hypothetical protein
MAIRVGENKWAAVLIETRELRLLLRGDVPNDACRGWIEGFALGRLLFGFLFLALSCVFVSHDHSLPQARELG